VCSNVTCLEWFFETHDRKIMSELLKSLGICEKRAKATVACGVTVSELPSLASPDNVRYVSADKVTLGMYGLFLSKNTTVSRSSSNSEVHRHSINFYFYSLIKAKLSSSDRFEAQYNYCNCDAHAPRISIKLRATAVPRDLPTLAPRRIASF
jgi:hypothetical protein